MARLPRLCPPGIPQHIIQRGSNRQTCFASEEDFAAYARWLRECSVRYSVEIHAWVFMTNHVHLLATAYAEQSISKMMQSLGRYYVRYFNRRHHRTGTLWEGRFKSSIVDKENYLLICQRYIELNPVRAGMVIEPSKYRWSSYQANGLAKQIALWTPHPIYLQLGKTPAERAAAYRTMFKGQLEESQLTQIRETTNRGMALGSERFKLEIEALTGQRVRPLRRGPKPIKKGFYTDPN